MSPNLDVVSYNIRLGVESDLAAIAAAVRAGGVPDLLALQEVGDHWNMGQRVDQAKAVAEALGLGFATFAGALTDAEGGRYGIALCARYPLDHIRVEPLPRIEDEQRVMLRATLRHAREPVAVFAAHLSIEDTERRAQAEVLGAAVAEAARRMPTVMLGDLNDLPGTETIRLARGGLFDAFDEAGRGAPETFSVVDPHRRIDYIVCGGGLRPVACHVDRAGIASDHFPLRARLAFAEHGAASGEPGR